MIIPKSKRKQRKLFIELRYLEKTGFKDIKRLIIKSDIKSLVEQPSNKVFKGNGEYPHPPKLEDKEWDATYQAAYGPKAIEFQEDRD